MSTLIDVDPYLPNAYSTSRNDPDFPNTGCRFDLVPPPKLEAIGKTKDKKEELGKRRELLADPLSLKKESSKGWELDVRGLVSTRKWLSNYGLKKNKLDVTSLMKTIGFKKRDDFDYSLRKPIPSKYATGVGFLEQYTAQDGTITNVAINKARLQQIVTQLKQALTLFRRRLEWLTTESRRIFGVIQESMVIIILDIKTMSPQQFDQYRCSVETVLREQVATVAKFNLYRATEEPLTYRPECVPVTQKSIDEAIDWLWTLDRTAGVGQSSVCEAVIKALQDPQAQGIYLFTQGSSSEASLELMLTNCQQVKKPLQVVSYNCTNADVIKGLKNLADLTKGRFHAYGVVLELDHFEVLPVEENSNKAQIALRKRTIGGVPSGAGVRDDVILLFEEIEECMNNLGSVEKLADKMGDVSTHTKYDKGSKNAVLPKRQPSNQHLEEYMGSQHWIKVNGLKVKKLTFNGLLGRIAFKHCDGVVRVQSKPLDEEYKTDANSTDKLINARYCDQFAHVKWVDGTIVHVQVTPETHRQYEEKVAGLLHKISARIRWLKQGSRELFGTIIERRLYILIDTSASMVPSLQFVKDKFFLLLQEQLRHKDAFNIISFGSKIMPWRDRLVEVNEENLKNAWTFVKNLECDGSTNTLGAVKYALSDANTQGIYLLSDGRPDHPPKSVLAQVNLQKAVPIHSISFNCADAEANRFLFQMAKDTSGRYHYFSEHGVDTDGPAPYQSEDIRMLTEEYELGEKYLGKVADLRDECQELQWKRSAQAKFSRLLPQPSRRLSRPTSSSTLLRSSAQADSVRSSVGGRPYQSLPTSHSAPVLHTEHHTGHSIPYRPHSYRRPVSRAAHTKTSLLRTLSYSGANDWCLPESRAMLKQQFQSAKAKPVALSPTPISAVNCAPKSKEIKKKKVKYLSSKNWLVKNSLQAQKLLLLDALSEAIRRDHEKTTDCNEDLAAQLLEEEGNSTNNNARAHLLSNPFLEVCLEDYEVKLKEALENFYNRLDKIVIGSLSNEERNKYDDDSESLSFRTKRADLMNSLDACGWPINHNDVLALEEEIRAAEDYLKQSMNIRRVAEKYEKRPVQQPSSSKISPTSHAKRRAATDHLKGQRVIARKSASGFYDNGVALRSHGPHHCLVQFCDGQEQKVPKQFVVQTKGAVAVPNLMMGDYVLILVKGTDNQPCYVPGQVMLTPKQSGKDGKFYEVLLYNDSKVSALRSSMVKIGKARHSISVAYINERNGGGSEHSGSDLSDNEPDTQATVKKLQSKYENVEQLCQAIIDKQKSCKARQKKLSRQMRRIHKTYQQSSDQSRYAESDVRKKLTFSALNAVETGEEVLARWLDEGWYYRCLVQRRVSEKTYMLKDSCGDIQQTSRDDIITDDDDSSSKIHVDHYVIALHPNYYYSYAPGIVDEVFDDDSCSITFYDNVQSVVEREELFLIDKETYHRDVSYIEKCERDIIGQPVVARDNETGYYRLGSIQSMVEQRVYNVEWSDKTTSKQSCVHIFGIFNKTCRFRVGDHCLAIIDEEKYLYLPGCVTSVKRDGRLDVEFPRNERVEGMDPMKCFWLAENYYEAASAYFNNRNKSPVSTPPSLSNHSRTDSDESDGSI